MHLMDNIFRDWASFWIWWQLNFTVNRNYRKKIGKYSSNSRLIFENLQKEISSRNEQLFKVKKTLWKGKKWHAKVSFVRAWFKFKYLIQKNYRNNLNNTECFNYTQSFYRKVIINIFKNKKLPFMDSGNNGNPTAIMTAMMWQHRWLNEHEHDSRGYNFTACRLPVGDFTMNA